MKSVYLKHLATAAFCIITLVSAAQSPIADYPLNINSRDSIGNFGAMIYGNFSSKPPSSACAFGIYDPNDKPDLGAFSTPNLDSLFNKQNFQIDVDFNVNTNNFGVMGKPVFLIGPNSRTLGIYISSKGFIGIKYNDTAYQFSTTKHIDNAVVYHASLRYVFPTAQLVVDGNVEVSTQIPVLAFAPDSDPLQVCITAGDGGNGQVFQGCMNNLIVYDMGVVLPVIMLSFDARLQSDNSCMLNWSVANGTSPKSFDIQRSKDGTTTWNTIGTVRYGQNSSAGITYSFRDNMTLNGNNYYRLKQTDQNGQISYSAIRVVNTINAGNKIRLLPNPVRDRLYITGVDWTLVQAVTLMNSTGAIIYKATTAKDGINVSQFAAGTYFLTVQTSNTSVFKGKVMVVK